MPISVVAQAGVIAISMAVVAAIVVYENPEVRRMADNLKQRIAIAVQSIGDNMNPEGPDAARRRRNSTETAEEEPIFNRPEDAEGFLMSRGRRPDGDPGVIADEATRRRQREELLYWNRQQMQRQQETQQQVSRSASNSSTSWQPREALEAMQNATREVAAAAGISLPSFINKSSCQPSPSPARPNTSFDQFLRPDTSAADRGTFVMNANTNADEAFGTTSSSNINNPGSGTELLRRRRPEAAGLSYANPFADEYGIELDDHEFREQIRAYEEATRPKDSVTKTTAAAEPSAYRSASSADRSDTMSDMYSATEPDTNTAAYEIRNDAVFDPLPVIAEQQQQQQQWQAVAPSSAGAASEVFFDADNELSNSAIHTEAFDSIQAWAQNSSSASLAGFYSPLPVTPTEAMSEPSEISSVGDGELTPTGSMSIIGSVAGSDAGSDAGSYPVSVSGSAAGSVAGSAPSIIAESASGSAAGDYGVVSDDSDGIMTPTSWSDVGSVVSENDAVLHA